MVCMRALLTRAAGAGWMRAVLFVAGCMLVSGCGAVAPSPWVAGTAISLRGLVHGGQQPVSHALIGLYAAGTTGRGSAATPLLSQPVFTDSVGDFELNGLYRCPSPDAQIMITAQGGYPGLPTGVDNKSIAMMAALGPCAGLANVYVNLNEETTIAAVWALAPFMRSLVDVGSDAGDPLFTDAVLQAQQLVDLSSGVAPGTTLPPGYVVQVNKVNHLSDILALCINSGGGVAGDGSPCGLVFQAATETTGSSPKDTVTAALHIAENPTRNVAALFNCVPPTAPFQSTLTSIPADWTLSLLPIPSAPAITPGSGSYSTAQLVTIADTTPGTEVHYTLDGAEPSLTSPVYTGPITVAASTIVTAVAFLGNVQSAVTQASINVSTAPPSTKTLAFVVQPSSVLSGYSLSPVAVETLDASGKPITMGLVPVTLSLVSNSAEAALAGTLTQSSAATPAIFADLMVAQPGTGYSLVASSPGYTSVSSTAFSVAAAATNTAGTSNIYYVSSLGSDSADGSTPATAWQTIGKVNATVVPAGTQVLFQSGGVWHEELLPQSGVRYAAYGGGPSCVESSLLVPACTKMPVIDGADPVTGWTAYASAAYKAPYTATASKGFVDALYQQTVPLTLTTSIASVAATSGTIYSDGSFVYVHLADGSSPATHTVEVSGIRKYGIFVNGPSSVVIDGLEVIRTAKSGYLNYSFTGTGKGNIVQNSTFFNSGDSIGDAALGGQIEASILAIAGFGQVPPTGFIVSGNLVGQSDFAHATLNYSWAGIQLDGMGSPQVIGNRVATVNGWAIRVQDWFTANTCTSPMILGNETVNSEGNIGLAGCVNSLVKLNSAHDSFGNFAQLGSGLNLDNLDAGSHLEYNTFTRLNPAYLNGLYNGIDVNHAINLVILGNQCSAVASACLTLEADSGPSSGATVAGNTFDASSNVTWQGAAPGDTKRVYPFYIRDTSLAGGLTMSANVLIMNPVTPYIKFGATYAGDQTHDLTQSQFDLACPKCELGTSSE